MNWISWYQPTDDYRPVNFPPSEKILAWWCTGQSDKGAVICCLVDELGESEAKAQIVKNWPEAEQWRFCEIKTDKKFNDRFPVSDWMIARGCSND